MTSAASLTTAFFTLVVNRWCFGFLRRFENCKAPESAVGGVPESVSAGGSGSGFATGAKAPVPLEVRNRLFAEGAEADN